MSLSLAQLSPFFFTLLLIISPFYFSYKSFVFCISISHSNNSFTVHISFLLFCYKFYFSFPHFHLDIPISDLWFSRQAKSPLHIEFAKSHQVYFNIEHITFFWVRKFCWATPGGPLEVKRPKNEIFSKIGKSTLSGFWSYL